MSSCRGLQNHKDDACMGKMQIHRWERKANAETCAETKQNGYQGKRLPRSLPHATHRRNPWGLRHQYES